MREFIKKFFLLASVLFMVVAGSGCAWHHTFQLDQLALQGKQMPQNKEGQPVFYVKKKVIEDCVRITGLFRRDYSCWRDKDIQATATSEMLIPYLMERIPNARFQIIDNTNKQNGILLELTKIVAVFHTHFRIFYDDYTEEVKLSYKLILPDGTEKEFSASSEHKLTHSIIEETAMQKATVNCLNDIADQIVNFLIQQGIVNPNQVTKVAQTEIK